MASEGGSVLEDKTNEDKEYCSNCLRHVAVKNFVIHSVHCIRNIEVCKLCKEPFPIKEMEHHVTEYHSVVPCEKCHKTMEKWLLDQHNNECIKRPISCKFCDLNLPLDDMPEHENYCGSRTQACGDCGHYIMIRNKKSHVLLCKEEQVEKKPRAATIGSESFLNERNVYSSSSDNNHGYGSFSYGNRKIVGEHGNSPNDSSYDYGRSNASVDKNKNERSTRENLKSRIKDLTEEEMALIKMARDNLDLAHVKHTHKWSVQNPSGEQLEIKTRTSAVESETFFNKRNPQASIKDNNSEYISSCYEDRKIFGRQSTNVNASSYDFEKSNAFGGRNMNERSTRGNFKTRRKGLTDEQMNALIKMTRDVLVTCYVCNKSIPKSEIEDHKEVCNGEYSLQTEMTVPVVPLTTGRNFDQSSPPSYEEIMSQSAAVENKLNERLEDDLKKFLQVKSEECPICSVRIPSNKLEKHMSLCVNQKTLCNFCQCEILRLEEIEHLRTCSGVKALSEENNTSYNVENQHSLFKQKSCPKETGNKVPEKQDTETKPFAQKSLDSTFDECPICQVSFPSNRLEVHVQLCLDKKTVCHFCNSLINIDEEVEHLRTCSKAKDTSSQRTTKVMCENTQSTFADVLKKPFNYFTGVRSKEKPTSAPVCEAELDVCHLCGSQFDKSDIQHLNRCLKKSRRCRYCCSIQLPDKFKIHIEEECKAFDFQKWNQDRGSGKRGKKKPSSTVDFSNFFEKIKDNIPSPAKDALSEIVMLPCEFCGELCVESEIIIHQSGCRPDLVSCAKRSVQEATDAMNEQYSEAFAIRSSLQDQIWNFRATTDIAESDKSDKMREQISFCAKAVGSERKDEYFAGDNVSPTRRSIRQSNVTPSKKVTSDSSDDEEDMSKARTKGSRGNISNDIEEWRMKYKYKGHSNKSGENMLPKSSVSSEASIGKIPYDFEQWKRTYNYEASNNNSSGECVSSKKSASLSMTNSEHSHNASSSVDHERQFPIPPKAETPQNRNFIANSSFEDKCFPKNSLDKKFEWLTPEQSKFVSKYLNNPPDDETQYCELASAFNNPSPETIRGYGAIQNPRSPLSLDGKPLKTIWNKDDTAEDAKPKNSHVMNMQSPRNSCLKESCEDCACCQQLPNSTFR